MRTQFSKSLIELAKNDPQIILLTGDHGYALFDEFRRVCPKQYINAGIAEQNMVGMAAGLARSGFRPFVYGLSAFIPIRVLEQIKLDVAHDSLPVVFIGDGAGLVYSQLGTSHQSTEDIACTRAIPNLSVFSPADRHELSECMRNAYLNNSSVYLRIGKADRGDIHSIAQEMKVGSLINIKAGISDQICFIATGSMVKTAIDITNNCFSNESIWSAPYIKPIDTKQVIDAVKNCKLVVVIEEHSEYGGLGSVIAEITSEYFPKRMLRVGIRDKFSKACGDYQYILSEHGLDLQSIQKRIFDRIDEINK